MRKYIKWILLVAPLAIYAFFMSKILKLKKNKTSRIKVYRKIKKVMIKVCKLIDVTFIVDGIENLPYDESYLITPNHQSMIDPFVFFTIINDPISFVCKESVKKIPVVSDFVDLCDGVYLERGSLKQEIKMMKKIQSNMLDRSGRYILFPEGTRTRSETFEMGQFKPGAFKYTMAIGKKIVPVAMHGSHFVLDPKINKKKFYIQVSILEPLTKKDYENLTTQEVADLVKERINTRLKELIENHPNL